MKAIEEKHYQVSGLDYTMPKLLIAIGLILLGYFGMGFSLTAVPRIVPLKLKELGISSTMMVFIMSTLGSILNMTVCPWVSFKSDRYRSKRWGRRVAFIIYTLPFMCLSWLMIGFCNEESALLTRLIPSLAKLSTNTLIIIVLGTSVVIFKFFYMFVGSVFHYIYYDAIPPQFHTRLAGGLQITATAAAALFNFFIFKHALTHFRAIFVIVTIVYAVLMGAMCFFLKEPRFPEPDPEEKAKGEGLKGLISFWKESYSSKFYLYGYLQTTFAGAAGATSIFSVFMEQNMGLSLADIGKLSGVSGICGTVLMFIIATIGSTLIDKWHPVRTYIFLMPFALLLSFYYLKWFFLFPTSSIYWWSALLLAMCFFSSRFTGIAGMPFLMRTLPKSRFGQFCSARSLVSSLFSIFLALVVGVLMDILKARLGDHAYRAIYFWNVFFHLLNIGCCYLMFHEYKKLGGYNNYKAPASWEASGYEKMDKSPVQEPNPTLLSYTLFGFDLVFLASAVTAVVFAILARRAYTPSEARNFLLITLPIAIGIFVLWSILHGNISSRIKKYKDGLDVALPHHGLMCVVLLSRVMCLVVFILQSWLALKKGTVDAPNKATISSSLMSCDLIIDLFLLLFLWCYVKLEMSTRPKEEKKEEKKEERKQLPKSLKDTPAFL